MKSITVNNHPITYVEAGDPGRRTIVLLSGWAQDDRLFKTLIPELARDFHVIAPNYRGHDAEQTLHGDFTGDDLVDDMAEFIAALGLKDFRLVSTSHGCWVNIGLCDRLGTKVLPRTVVIDWLMEPHDGFWQQLREGQDPENFHVGRKSFFDEWIAATDNADVINHISNEMTWFKGEMWIRACREIEKNYRKWGSPLKRMEAMADRPEIMHVYSQPLSEDYRKFQNDYAANGHPWFIPHHIPGQTHFPTLENPVAVGAAIAGFFKG